MSTALHQLAQHADSIRQRGAELGVHDIRVSGSVARAQERASSDVDLLVSSADASPLDLAEFAAYVSKLLSRRVDVFVLPAALSTEANPTARSLVERAVELGATIPATDAGAPPRSSTSKLLALLDDIAAAGTPGHT